MQFVGENIQQYFGIGVGAQMAPILHREVLSKLFVIGQIAIVRQANPIRRIDVKRLCFG